MVVILIVVIVVIIPAMMVINVIWWIKELHTKYYFFVTNLLVVDIDSAIFKGALKYLIMILYMFDLNSESAATVLQWLAIPVGPLTHFMTALLPISVAMERLIVIAFSYRHRSIVTTKTVISILAAMWGMSLILTRVITVIVPIDIVWPLGMVYFDSISIPFFVFP